MVCPTDIALWGGGGGESYLVREGECRGHCHQQWLRTGRGESERREKYTFGRESGGHCHHHQRESRGHRHHQQESRGHCHHHHTRDMYLSHRYCTVRGGGERELSRTGGRVQGTLSPTTAEDRQGREREERAIYLQECGRESGGHCHHQQQESRGHCHHQQESRGHCHHHAPNA